MTIMEFVGNQYRKMDEWVGYEENFPKQIAKGALVGLLDGAAISIIFNGIAISALGFFVIAKNLAKK